MKQLFIEQFTTTGEKKVWKLGADKRQYTFGTSRTADLVSLDNSLELWEGVFEFDFDNESWHYISMNSTSHKTVDGPLIILDGKIEIKFAKSTLNLNCIARVVELNKFHVAPISSGKNTKKLQIFQVCFGDQIIETQIIPFSKKFIPKSIPGTGKIEPIPSASWHVSKIGDFVLKQKTIEAEKPSALNSIRKDDFIDKDSVPGLISLGVLCLIFFMIYILAPRTEKYIPVSKKATATRIFVMDQPKKEKNKVQVQDETQKLVTPVTEKVAAAGDAKPSKNNKIAGMLKNLNTGRITSLISKVSAQGQRSKTVVISDGVLAGSGPSGRALAALGKVEKSGSDWSQENGTKGFKISTNGIGGGKNVNSFATLSGGKVGKGGVGLIEDESEVVGGLDREEIASYIRTQLGQILYCYERQLSANKELFGKVSVKFTISGSGKVETQAVSDTTLKNTTVEGCMLNKIASWKFPAPRGGTKVIVTYPFLFKSTN